MKTFLSSIVLASATAVVLQAAPEPTVKAGSTVNLEPVAVATWVQGAAPTAFEPGKVYMFECWATWCGPCVAAIPHVNELHKKYYDKGLRVFGMNVWEDGQDKVEKFVKAKGEGMSYPVAYTGKGSAFEKQWLVAAGVRGIPHAFVVKDGKIVMTSHPSQITDSVIEALLSGGEGAKKAADEINAAAEARNKMSLLMKEFRAAGATGDTGTMAAKLAELEKIEACKPYLPSLRLDLLIAKKDWPAATAAITDMPEGASLQMSLAMSASKIASQPDGEYPVEFTKAVSKAYASLVDNAKAPASPYSLLMLASIQWKAGEMDTAKASAHKAAEIAGKQTGARQMPATPFERFAKSMDDGVLPSMKEFSAWLNEAMPKSSVPATKIKPAPAAK